MNLLLSVKLIQWAFIGVNMAILSIVYVLEYVFGYESCMMCLFERSVYLVVIFLQLMHLYSKKMALAAKLIPVVYGIGCFITTYHISLELGIITGSACSIYGLSCSIPQYLFGISITALNLITSIAMIISSVILLKYYKKNFYYTGESNV